MKTYIYEVDERPCSSQIRVGVLSESEGTFWKSLAQRAVDDGVIKRPGKYIAVAVSGDQQTVAHFEVEQAVAPLKVVGI